MDYLFEPMEIIDKSMPVIDLPNALPFMTGDGPHNYLCGECRNVLMSKIEMPRPQRVMIICGKCRTANLMTGRVSAHAAPEVPAELPHSDQVNEIANLVEASVSPPSIGKELPLYVASADTGLMAGPSQDAESKPSGTVEPSLLADKA